MTTGIFQTGCLTATQFPSQCKKNDRDQTNNDTVATPQSTRARECCSNAACAPEPLRHMAYT